MGCLRADALGRFIERRASSIGTPAWRSQRKLRILPVLATLLVGAAPRAVIASPSPSPSVAPQTAPAQPSPFTGAPAPLPPPPPPQTGAPPASNSTLPAAPPPKSTQTVAVAAAPALIPPGAPGAPGNDLPPPPWPPHGLHLHDGFYLRMALGLAGSGALVSSDSTGVPDYSFAGGGAAGDLWIGGTPTPGLAMGGALSAFGVNSRSRHSAGESISGTVNGSMGLLGFFVDGFPDPERGFHFGGALGLASGHADAKGVDKSFDGGGVGLGAWVGYDLWVGSQWSIGGMVRFMGSITRAEIDNVSYQTSLGGASLSFTALYH